MKKLFCYLKSKTNDYGFTFVELLTVIGIVIVVGSIMGSILLSTLRGTNKANLIANVRQNGNYAISQMSKMLRDAKSLDGASNTNNGTDWECILGKTYKYLKMTGYDGGETVFTCSSGASGIISSNSASLVDTSVYIQSCSINCSQGNSTDSPIIGIDFFLSGKTNSGLGEQQVTPIEFETSITLRNLNR